MSDACDCSDQAIALGQHARTCAVGRRAGYGPAGDRLDKIVAEVASREHRDAWDLESLADRVSVKYLDRDQGPVDPDADLKVALQAGAGVSLDAVRGVAEAARTLKATETAYREAQQHYGEAVKRLSEEAVK